MAIREITFRGKRVDNDEWVVGDLIHRQIWKRSLTIIRVSDDGFDHYEEYEVIPETVGQFTGLTDKNGNKIFEGDIVKYAHPAFAKPLVGIISWEQSETGFVLRNEKPFYYWLAYTNELYEIIGNIHDREVDE